jgi:hypothetical protein
MAISFGHKDGGWKSRYSYTPKCMFGVNKDLYSTNEIGQVHKHNEGPNNSFYGVTQNSGISVAFNDNLSANKIFKSVSVEGSETLENASHQFYAYRSTDPSKYYKPSNLEPLKVKGGVLYGALGRDQSLINGATMHYVGDVERIEPLSELTDYYPGIGGVVVPDEYIAVVVNTSGSDYVPEPGVRYGLYYSGRFYFGEGTQDAPVYRDFESIQEYRDVPALLSLPLGSNVLSRSEQVDHDYSFAYAMIHPSKYLTSLGGQLPPGYEGGISLFAFKDPAIHGGDLRGQRAEMFLNLGSEDFELYAVNLNYESVNADHTK